jgi:hypothetical protein
MYEKLDATEGRWCPKFVSAIGKSPNCTVVFGNNSPGKVIPLLIIHQKEYVWAVHGRYIRKTTLKYGNTRECKGCPATRHGGTWGQRRYSSYSYLTSALDGGEWSASRPGRALPPVPTGWEAGWAPEPVWMQRLEEKSSAPVGDRTPIVQPVVRHYTAWATAALIQGNGANKLDTL